VADSDTDASVQSITIQLNRDQLRHLDDLREGRNLSRGQVIVELIEQAKGTRRQQRGQSGRQRANPWGQVWPG
jgi:hypothetical protein